MSVESRGRKATHGMSGTRIYRIWACMKNRCHDSNNPRYHDYGGRGIKACDEWLKFENFYKDMGDPPSNKTLDRIDNNEGYNPNNCKWSTVKEQRENMRNNVYLTYNGETKLLMDWAKQIGIKRHTLETRIYRGWTTERALNKPVVEKNEGGRVVNLTERAYNFAFMKHRGQTRKYTGEPYINHPVAVAETLTAIQGSNEMIAAALLHDVVEDTNTTIEEIIERFGFDVGKLVANVTDVSFPSDGNRKARKAKDLAHIAKASPDGKTIKLADLIHNTKSILECDPEFAKVYMIEKRELLKVLKDGNACLYRQAEKIVDDYFKLKGQMGET